MIRTPRLLGALCLSLCLAASSVAGAEEGGERAQLGVGARVRYVFLPEPDGRFLNIEMLRAGMARAYTRFPFRFLEEFRALQEDARRQGRGLWAEGARGKTCPPLFAS